MRRNDRRVGPRHLTSYQVKAIRTLRSWGLDKLSRAFDTSPSNVSYILRRVTHRDVK